MPPTQPVDPDPIDPERGDPDDRVDRRLSRRRLIGLLAGAAAVAAGGGVTIAVLRGDEATSPEVSDDGLVVVGRRAHEVLPEGDDAEALAAALAPIGGLPIPTDDAVTLENRLTTTVEAITADYRAGRTVDLDGWVLSETEARLCALIALAR